MEIFYKNSIIFESHISIEPNKGKEAFPNFKNLSTLASFEEIG